MKSTRNTEFISSFFLNEEYKNLFLYSIYLYCVGNIHGNNTFSFIFQFSSPVQRKFCLLVRKKISLIMVPYFRSINNNCSKLDQRYRFDTKPNFPPEDEEKCEIPAWKKKTTLSTI